MPRYYIMQDGARLYKKTQAEITKAARALANATGIGVPVHVETALGSRRAGSAHSTAPFVRNPSGGYTEKALYTFRYGGKQYGVFSGDFVQGGGMGFHASAITGPARDAFEAAKAKYEGTFKRNPVMQGYDFTGEEWKVTGKGPRGGNSVAYANSKQEAQDEARVLRQHGVTGINIVRLTAPMKSNPGTKASKARRVASNKRGAYVEYLDRGVKRRVKYGNKGIATIRARAMIADGFKGVRVVSA